MIGFYIERDDEWGDGAENVFHGVVLVIGGLCAPIVFPIVTVFITWRKLYLGVDTPYMTRLIQYKLVENICEGLPQMIISIIFIANNPDQSDILNYLSLVISAGSVLIGLLISGRSCYNKPITQVEGIDNLF